LVILHKRFAQAVCRKTHWLICHCFLFRWQWLQLCLTFLLTFAAQAHTLLAVLLLHAVVRCHCCYQGIRH
jgi:hypothetical protein